MSFVNTKLSPLLVPSLKSGDLSFVSKQFRWLSVVSGNFGQFISCQLTALLYPDKGIENEIL